jgi:hypothetical protein
MSPLTFVISLPIAVLIEDLFALFIALFTNVAKSPRDEMAHSLLISFRSVTEGNSSTEGE